MSWRVPGRYRVPGSAVPPKDAWEALARCTDLPALWIAVVVLATLASLIRVTNSPTGTTIEFRVTTVSAALIALLWLPTLLRVIALTGGNLKTSAGEASTTGLLDHFRDLPPDQQEESLSAAAAVVDRVETQGPLDQRSQARQVREGIEEAIAEIPRQSSEVERRLREVAREYERLRAEMEPSSERTTAMTQLVSRARGLAASGTPTDPRRWYRQGTEGARIVALAAIQALKDPRNVSLVLDAIEHPRSAFEQFQALRAADLSLDSLDAEQLGALRTAIENQLCEQVGDGRWITQGDASRWQYAHSLLEAIGRKSGSTTAPKAEG